MKAGEKKSYFLGCAFMSARDDPSLEGAIQQHLKKVEVGIGTPRHSLALLWGSEGLILVVVPHISTLNLTAFLCKHKFSFCPHTDTGDLPAYMQCLPFQWCSCVSHGVSPCR